MVLDPTLPAAAALSAAGAGLGWAWGGSCLGACAAWLPGRLSPRVQSGALGLAAGVMVAAALLSLLPQALDVGSPWAVLGGFAAGIALMLGLDAVVPHQHPGADAPDHGGGGLAARTGLLIALALTLHNIPEGLAVGLAALDGSVPALGNSVVLAIALHNVLEGVLVALPLRLAGFSRLAAFGLGQAAAAAEVLAGVGAVLVVGFAGWLLPAGLAAAAGAMIFVVLEELYPEALRAEAGNAAPIGAVAGVSAVIALTALL